MVDNKPQRRARSRRAQHTFQQRRQAAISTLQRKVKALEAAVEAMSQEFIDFGDRMLTLSSSQDVVLADLQCTTSRFLSLAKASQEAAMGEQGEEYVETEAEGDNEQQSEPPGLHLNSLHGFDASFAAGVANEWQQHQNLVGLDFDDTMHHYEVGQSNTFANNLYLDTLGLSLCVLRGETNLPGFIPSVAKYRLRHEGPAQLAACIQMRMDVMKSEHGGRCNYFDCSQLVGDPQSYTQWLARDGGGSLRDWHDPWGAYQYMKRRWGVHFVSGDEMTMPRLGLRSLVFGHHLTVFDDGFPVGEQQGRVTVSAGQLIRRLTLGAVCFGDGARYSKENIDSAVLWFHESGAAGVDEVRR
jgi:hypothetical protein